MHPESSTRPRVLSVARDGAPTAVTQDRLGDAYEVSTADAAVTAGPGGCRADHDVVAIEVDAVGRGVTVDSSLARSTPTLLVTAGGAVDVPDDRFDATLRRPVGTAAIRATIDGLVDRRAYDREVDTLYELCAELAALAAEGTDASNAGGVDRERRLESLFAEQKRRVDEAYRRVSDDASRPFSAVLDD